MPSQANVFLIVNLGCEMMYVIDQRLKAQCISVEKSAQVLRDLTMVLLDPKFLAQFMNTPNTEQNLLTPQQCRILLSDIACCSLMRLDIQSMDKLWDLMLMVFKWQLSVKLDDCQHLLAITFRHMDGIGRLMPDAKKFLLIDCAKRHLIEFWDSIVDKEFILQNILKWLSPFHIKISILIRLGFQRTDGTIETFATLQQSASCDTLSVNNGHFQYYIEHVGDNIYVKHANLQRHAKSAPFTVNTAAGYERSQRKSLENSHELDTLIDQLNISQTNDNQHVTNIMLDDVYFNLKNSEMTYDNVQQAEPDDDETNDQDQILIKEGCEIITPSSTTSTLESILKKFRFENNMVDGERNTEELGGLIASQGRDDDFDATEELLKMLDES